MKLPGSRVAMARHLIGFSTWSGDDTRGLGKFLFRHGLQPSPGASLFTDSKLPSSTRRSQNPVRSQPPLIPAWLSTSARLRSPAVSACKKYRSAVRFPVLSAVPGLHRETALFTLHFPFRRWFTAQFSIDTQTSQTPQPGRPTYSPITEIFFITRTARSLRNRGT